MIKKTRRELFAEIKSLTSFKEGAALRIEDLRKTKREHENQISNLSSRIRELNRLFEVAENKTNDAILHCNDRADLINNILKIVLGEAKPNSKYEVIRDLFLPQIQEIDAHRELQQISRKMDHARHGPEATNLSDKITKEQLGSRW